jgi:hypothetical protein
MRVAAEATAPAGRVEVIVEWREVERHALRLVAVP